MGQEAAVNISEAQYAALLRNRHKPTKQRTTLPAPSEYDEQCAVVEWAHIMSGRYPELRWLFHVPNGGLRDPVVGMMLKRAGVQSGVPDLFLPAPRWQWHGLWIELKQADHSNETSPQQTAWLEYLRSVGYMAVVAYGAQAAIFAIENYLTMDRT